TCAVGTSGQAGCSACEDICPNDAIAIDTAGDGSVSVADARCVGCGSCVSTCPTDSIEPVQTADLDALLPAVERAVAPVASAGERGGLLSRRSAPDPVVVAFVADSLAETYRTAVTSRAVPAVVPVFVPNALSVPDVAPLAAVAAGADAVVLATDPRRPTAPVTDAVEGANRVLADVGAPEAVSMANTDDPDALAAALTEAEPASALPTASVSDLPVESRHDAGLALASALVDVHASGETAVHVPGGGSVTIEAEGCTLCETCHGRCPTGALVQSTGTLTVDPAACVGCGVCESACPEDVIDVSATATVGASGVGEPRQVVEKEMVDCAVCGEPFASRAGLDAMRDQLDEAALEAIDLEVCPACRKRTQQHAGIPR
ncbi:MAG: 4Fe-4S binding protein, partial [Halobacterium sp.]